MIFAGARQHRHVDVPRRSQLQGPAAAVDRKRPQTPEALQCSFWHLPETLCEKRIEGVILLRRVSDSVVRPCIPGPAWAAAAAEEKVSDSVHFCMSWPSAHTVVHTVGACRNAALLELSIQHELLYLRA